MSQFKNPPNCSNGSLSKMEDMVKCRYYVVRRVRRRTSSKTTETQSMFNDGSFTLQKKEISICEIKVPETDFDTGPVTLPNLLKISEARIPQETSKRNMDEITSGEFHFDSTEKPFDYNSIRDAKLDEEDSVMECNSPTSNNMINKSAISESEESKLPRNISDGMTEVETIITSDDDSLVSPNNNNEHDVISIESDDDIEIVNVVKAPKNRLREKRERAQTRHQQQYLDFVVPLERVEIPMSKLQMKFRPKLNPKPRRRFNSSRTSTKLKFPENSTAANKRPRAVSVTHEKTSSSDKDCRVDTPFSRERPSFTQNIEGRSLNGTSQDKSTQSNKSGDEFDASMKNKCIPTQTPKHEAPGSVQKDGSHEMKSSFCWKKNTTGRKSFSTKKHYNYSNTKEDAFLEQERLFREAASRVRSHTKVHVIQQHDHSIFSEPVTDISKLPDSHWKFKDPYSRLGLPENSKTDLVKKHFRRLALLYHPDKAKGIDAANRFQAIKEAYELLMSRQD